ncbi:MAG: hypothetical protein KatS3mg002_0047 [Candidatus Woesearchaeota archaeon]|nr:MAG: hypothetical protein KatS3mg002_0047 [Candidatus Woesearchaeota archaeon]
MDWSECIEEKIVKEAKADKNLALSLKEIAKIKIKSADSLSEEFFISKISLLYDALREILEAIAIQKGFKIYNHECYAAFLKEILKMPDEANIFDNLRKTRNAINYYGRKLDKEESLEIIKKIKQLIEKLKDLA